jgi:hypothetical protein
VILAGFYVRRVVALFPLRIISRRHLARPLFTHPFHLVSRSSWPAMVRIALGVLTLRFAAAFNGLESNKALRCGGLVTLLTIL